MRVAMTYTVRGQERTVEWSDVDGLRGDDEIRDRLDRDPVPMDRNDLSSVIRAIERVVGQQVSITELDLRTRHPDSH
jgi:hypothetical protein